MSTPTTWWIPVRPEGTGYRGDARNYFAARGTTVTADIAPRLGADPWYGAAAGMIYAEETPEAALSGMPQEARLIQLTGTPSAVDRGQAALASAVVGNEHPRSLAYGPSGAQIAELIEAARGISVDQVLSVAAELNKTKPLHWNAAWRGAWELLPSKQCALVLADVRAAAQTGALTAARHDDRVLLNPVLRAAENAARALMVRHLIGAPKLKLKQAHYDAHTRVWRTVVGPLHPEDALSATTSGERALLAAS